MDKIINIVIGQFFHESNSFAEGLTGAEEFPIIPPGEMDLVTEDSQNEFAAFCKKGSEYGWNVIPIADAGSIPSGVIEKGVYENVKVAFTDGISRVDHVDGVLLSLHGASLAEGYDDTDGDFLKTIRGTVGKDVPVIATLDKHANVSALMVEMADVLLAYNKEPHEDPFERALEAGDLMNEILEGRFKPTVTCVHPPMMVPAINGCTDEDPMKLIMDKAFEYEKEEDVADVSVLIGFYGSDKAETGPCAIVTTNDNEKLSAEIANKMADIIWEEREKFFVDMMSVEAAIKKAQAEGGSWVFIDESDDPLGGASGDSVSILRTLIEKDIHSAALSPIADGEAVVKAVEAGVGARISVSLGGKGDPKYGGPVEIEAVVNKLWDKPVCLFDWDDTPLDVGKIAVLDCDGILILIGEMKMGVESVNIFDAVELDVSECNIIVVKGLGNTIKKSYGDDHKGFIEVEGEGSTNPDVTKLGEFKKLNRSYFPFDKAAEYVKTVYKNGVVYTADNEDSFATAIVTINDRIAYVGSDEIAECYINENTKIIDLEGKMIVPGFIDGHAHPNGTAIIRGKMDLVHCEHTPEAYRKAIEEYAEEHKDDPFLAGVGIRLIDFGDEGPDKSFLDEIVNDKPVVLRDASAQYVFLNSKALDACGINGKSEMPPGATMFLGDDGEPTGLFLDGTMFMDMDGMFAEYEGEMNVPTPEAFEEEWLAYQQEAVERGITAVCSGLGDDIVAREVIDKLAKEDRLMMRSAWLGSSLPGMFTTVEETIKLMDDAQKYNSDWQSVRGVKLYMDGTPYGGTALLMKPYGPESGFEEGFKGEPNYTEEDLNEIVAALDKAGYQVHGHCMGDGSVHMLIDAYQNAYEQNGMRDGRHTVVHVNMISTDDIRRMARFGFTAAMQVAWAWNDPFILRMTEKRIGTERAHAQYRVRDMVEAGVNVVASSDYSACDSTGGWSPLAGIETGVTRTNSEPDMQDNPKYVLNPDQAVTVIDVLRMYTANAAKEIFMEDKIGSLKPGMKADMVILAEDITKIEPKDISETEIVATIVDGKERYRGKKN